MTPEQEQLIIDHKWLVRARIRDLGYGRMTWADELEDVALLGLTEAASRYRMGPGAASFITFAKIRIDGAMKDYLRKMGKETEIVRTYDGCMSRRKKRKSVYKHLDAFSFRKNLMMLGTP